MAITTTPHTYFQGRTLQSLATVSQMMVETQQKQNMIVNPEWHAQQYPFMRAAWAEASEAMGHTTWEWWKNLDNNYYDVFREEKDIAEFHMELVDALHFLISAHIQNHVGVEAGYTPPFAIVNASQALMKALDHAYKRHVSDEWIAEFAPTPSLIGQPEQTLLRVEALVSACLDNNLKRAFEMLVEVAEWTDLGLSGLIGRYFAKATLNQHRWANGYKVKTYIKIWGDGKEDNFYLNRILTEDSQGLSLDELLEKLADGSWQEDLGMELSEMYGRVVRTGHCDHEACGAPLDLS